MDANDLALLGTRLAQGWHGNLQTTCNNIATDKQTDFAHHTINKQDRIQAAIRHIQTSVDIDPWAMELAVEALEKLGTNLAEVGTDTISRQWVKDVVKTADINHPLADSEIIPRLRQIQEQIGGSYAIDRAIEIIQSQPMRKKGKWIERECGTEDKAEGWPTVIACSCCDIPATTFYSEDCESRTQIKTHFCPHCGADMRERRRGC